MRELIFDQPHNLARLQNEVLAAVSALAPIPLGAGLFESVSAFSGDGHVVTISVPDDLSQEDEAAIAALVAAHDPAPTVVYAGVQTITARVTTTGTTPAELFRATVATLTGYVATVDLVGIDSGNGNMRYIKATVAVKRLNNGAILVGAPVVLANHADGTAGAWTITPSVDGNQFVIVCAGASGRTVNWFLRLQVDSFTPGGQS